MLVSADGLALSCGQPPATGPGEQSKAGSPRVWLLPWVSAGFPLVMLQAWGMHLPLASTIATSLPHHRRGADLPFLVSHEQHGPTSPPRPRTTFPSTGAVFLLAGTKGKGRKPKGKPFLTLKTPEDTELNCHHTKPTGRQQTPNQPLRTTVRGWANMPTQHETPQEVLTTGLAYPLPKAWPGTALYQAE